MDVDLYRDSKKMYIVITDPFSHRQKEMFIFLKQATQILMYCHNDFRKFIGEMLTVKYDRVALRETNRVLENLTN